MKRMLTALVLTMLIAAQGLTVFGAVRTMPDGGKFDAAFYASTYPDVAAAFGQTETLLYQHFLNNGRAEGRRPYAAVKVMPDGGLFDAAFYAAAYPDVLAAFGMNEALLYQHYLQNGKAEGRMPYALGTGAAAPATPAPAAVQISDNEWKTAYINYIRNKEAQFYQKYHEHPGEYLLVDVNGDRIPELYCSYGFTAAGDEICTYGPQGLQCEPLWIKSFSYLKGQNLFREEGGKMDVYWDEIYRIENGRIVRLHRADIWLPDIRNIQYESDGDIKYAYTWDGMPVTRDVYRARMASVFDEKRAIFPARSQMAMYNMNTIISLIRSY